MSELQTYIDEGRLIRHAWAGTDEHGRELACLLAALSPEVAEAQSAAACPAEIMPEWLAHLTVWMDDAGTEEAWPAMVRKYADIAGRWHILSAEQWQRLDYVCRRIALVEAMTHGGDPDGVCSAVLALLDSAIAGDEPAADEGRASAWPAEAAAAAAAEAAAWAAGATAGADRITTQILDAIEAEILAAEDDDE